MHIINQIAKAEARMFKAATRYGISWRIPTLLLTALVLAAGWSYASAAPWPDSPGPQTNPLVPGRRPLDTTENILILGSDQRPGDPTWRTDTLMVAAIDSAKGRVGLLSIPRDLYVEIPGMGADRINTVDEYDQGMHYRGGSPALLSAVLSQTLGIPTQHYVRIRMPGLAQLIDDVGGIDITLDAPLHENETDPELLKLNPYFTMDAGLQHMNGRTVLRYVRGRYVNGDFDRSRRQQQVIVALGQRLRGLNGLSYLPVMWQHLQTLVQTDLQPGDLFALASLAARLGPDQVHGRTFNYDLVTPYTTRQGAQVLLLGNRQRVDAWVDGLFGAPGSGGNLGASVEP
jgi:polyisoprenyl-teichoic acid--peptidoglycan teichoic acid transferase